MSGSRLLRSGASTALALLINAGLFSLVVALNGDVNAAVLKDRPDPPLLYEMLPPPEKTPTPPSTEPVPSPQQRRTPAPQQQAVPPPLELAAPSFAGAALGVSAGTLEGPALPAPVQAPPPAPPRSTFSSQELDGPVQALMLHKGTYPPRAQQRGIDGRVVVRVLIDENGRVAQARPVSGPGVLADAFIRDLRLSVFTPPMRQGKAVKAVRDISRHYRLPSGGEQ